MEPAVSNRAAARLHGTPGPQARILATTSPAAAPDYTPDYSRHANLIAETLLTRVMEDFAEERFVAATTAAALARLSAGKPALDAVASRLPGQCQTGERHCGKAEAEPFEGLPPRYRLCHAFRQLIEFVIHSFSLLNPWFAYTSTA